MADWNFGSQFTSRRSRVIRPCWCNVTNTWRTASFRPSSMVKRSRGQSTLVPSRRICWVMVPPDWAFHCQTRSRKASRPIAWRVVFGGGQLALDDHLGGDAGMVRAGLPERVAALPCAASGSACPAG